MAETITNAPICKTQICKRPLTYLEDSKCWRCLICNPLPTGKPAVLKKKPEFLDVKVTEQQVAEMIEAKLAEQVEVGQERIREIVRDELENWHIQKPPAMKDEIAETWGVSDVDVTTNNWRQQAKELGIPLFQRRKVDVLKDIEEKLDSNFNK